MTSTVVFVLIIIFTTLTGHFHLRRNSWLPTPALAQPALMYIARFMQVMRPAKLTVSNLQKFINSRGLLVDTEGESSAIGISTFLPVSVNNFLQF